MNDCRFGVLPVNYPDPDVYVNNSSHKQRLSSLNFTNAEVSTFVFVSSSKKPMIIGPILLQYLRLFSVGGIFDVSLSQQSAS